MRSSTPVVTGEVRSTLTGKPYKIVAVVHAETSTGVKNPVQEIGVLLKNSETIYLVDAVTSLGGIESTMERRALIAGQENMPPTLIRFSVGCEHVEDLWRDLDRALAATADVH